MIFGVNLSMFALVEEVEEALIWRLSSEKCRRHRITLWVGKITWRRKWQPTPVFLPGQFHGQRRLVCYSPWDLKE